MAIQDDFTIDVVDRKITYTTAFVDDRPDTGKFYTLNELYSWLQDTFDEPAYMNQPVPMTAQTPTQYTMVYPWFIDNESVKALYGGSLQTSGWTKSGSEGITAIQYESFTVEPDSTDIGKAVTGDTSGATGVILAVDSGADGGLRDIVWVRNTSATQFTGSGGSSEVIDDDATGVNPDFTSNDYAGVQSGESVWANLYSVGVRQDGSEIYVGQEDDYLGGTAYHDADQTNSIYERRREKIDEWWDSDQDFATGSPNLLGGAGHFDILVQVQELGSLIDSGKLFAGNRMFGKIYSHFELTANVAGNFVVPLSSTGADLNSTQGPYEADFTGRSGTDFAVGDILENNTGTTPVGRLRAVATAVTGGASATGNFEYYLIGDTEPLATTDRTLIQIANGDDLTTRGTSTNDFDVNSVPSTSTAATSPAVADGITVTFDDYQVDVDEDSTDEEYACQIDCNSKPLAQVYRRLMYLTCRGNQDGTTPDSQDTLLPSGQASNEAGEFYRAVGDIIITWDARAAAGISEGELVKGSLSGAYGVVVSATETSTGVGVLTQVKGTFEENDVVSDIDDGAVNTVTLDATAFTTIAQNTASPFGAFAGGRFFFARGVVPTNVPAADANNWETVALGSLDAVAPPTQRAITFDGLDVGYRASIFEVGTAGGIDIVKTQNGVGAAGAAVSDTSIPLDSTIANDVPTEGWMRIVDDSGTAGEEYRYEYSAVSGTTVTLRPVAPDPGTCSSAGTATLLNDTGQFATFGTDGQCKVGHEIRNITDGSIATILRKVSDDQIETTPLTGGTSNDWANADTYEVNQVVVALVDADTCYFGFIDDVVVSGTSLTSTVKYVHATELLARARYSDVDIGPSDRKIPYERLNFQLTDADLTVTAVLNDDTIAATS